MKKQNLILALAMTFSATVFAQVAQKPAAATPANSSTPAAVAASSNQDDGQFELRQRLIAQYKDKQSVSIGIFPGTVENADLFFLVNRYLPLSNYLSEQSGTLVSFIPLKRSGMATAAAKEKAYDFIYTNAETAVDAVANGYVPLVKRNDPIQGVWLTRKNSPLNSMADLEGKKVGVVDRAMVTTLSRHSLITKGLLDKVSYVDGTSAGQNGLVEALKSGVVDAIVVRSSVANRLIRENADLYKIVDKTEEVPGFLLMARADVSPQLASSVAQSFLGLTNETQKGRLVLSGFDAATSTANAFVRAEVQDLDYIKVAVPAVAAAKSNLSQEKMK